MKSGKEYEILIEKIYKELSPKAKIVRNDKILGFDSGIYREIDLSIRSNVLGHEILILVQAKDYKTAKADINAVGEFITVIKDLRASKGILICNYGFTEGAISLAKNQGIDLCSVHDVSIKKWNLELKIPMLLKTFNKSFSLEFGLRSNEALAELNKKDIQLDISFNGKDFTFDNGNTTLSLFELIQKQSQTDFKFIELGSHKYNLMEDNLKFIVQNVLVHVEKLNVTVIQDCSHYLKFVDAEEYRGIKNLSTNEFNPSFLSFKAEIKPNIPDETWQKIESDQIAISPLTLFIETDSALNEGTYTNKKSEFKIIKNV